MKQGIHYAIEFLNNRHINFEPKSKANQTMYPENALRELSILLYLQVKRGELKEVRIRRRKGGEKVRR